MEESQAEEYLTSLLGKNLRITTTDTRLFLGKFMCTDSDMNIILSQTFEYRQPAPPKPAELEAAAAKGETVVRDMSSRFLGLIVVPGEHVVKIELEEFASQLKGKDMPGVGGPFSRSGGEGSFSKSVETTVTSMPVAAASTTTTTTTATTATTTTIASAGV